MAVTTVKFTEANDYALQLACKFAGADESRNHSHLLGMQKLSKVERESLYEFLERCGYVGLTIDTKIKGRPSMVPFDHGTPVKKFPKGK